VVADVVADPIALSPDILKLALMLQQQPREIIDRLMSLLSVLSQLSKFDP
jgi:hypothetical protein